MMSVWELVIIGTIAVFMFTLLAGLVALLVLVTRRSRRVQEDHSARITREIEKIGALQASGRISAAESAELRQALEEQGSGTEAPGNSRRLCKASPAVLAGVCGGLAEWMNWDPTMVRLGYVLATLLPAFPGIILYVIMAIVMPRAPDAPPSKSGRALLVLVLVLLVLLVLAAAAVGYALLSLKAA